MTIVGNYGTHEQRKVFTLAWTWPEFLVVNYSSELSLSKVTISYHEFCMTVSWECSNCVHLRDM